MVVVGGVGLDKCLICVMHHKTVVEVLVVFISIDLSLASLSIGFLAQTS